MKVGDIVVAKSNCIITGTSRRSLKIGKSYTILEANSREFRILDEENDYHWFTIEGNTGYRKWFHKPNYSPEIY